MNVLVVNCSAPHYNLGAAKLANWLRSHDNTVETWAGDPGVFSFGYDLVCLSVIFSWHAPIAREIALRVKANTDVWCGGPAMFALAKWWHRETGLEATRGLDWRFERQRGSYLMTFATRGCPVNCWFCVVPRIEGTEFTIDYAFQPAPVLCDNNLSALPMHVQRLILHRYRVASVPIKDCNSGFEPRTFTQDTFRLWSPVMRGPWRFALDTLSELDHVRRMMSVLRPVSQRKKQVYVLIGNEPFEACRERAEKVIEWGGEPYCQPMMPLNAMSRENLMIRHDWTATRLRDFQRYYNRHLWRSLPIQDYAPRKGEPRPFAGVAS